MHIHGSPSNNNLSLIGNDCPLIILVNWIEESDQYPIWTSTLDPSLLTSLIHFSSKPLHCFKLNKILVDRFKFKKLYLKLNIWCTSIIEWTMPWYLFFLEIWWTLTLKTICPLMTVWNHPVIRMISWWSYSNFKVRQGAHCIYGHQTKRWADLVICFADQMLNSIITIIAHESFPLEMT